MHRNSFGSKISEIFFSLEEIKENFQPEEKRSRLLVRKTRFHKFAEWSREGNRIAYSHLPRTRSRNVIFASVLLVSGQLSIARFFFSQESTRWKRARRRQQRACVFLYIVETWRRHLVVEWKEMVFQDRFPSSISRYEVRFSTTTTTWPPSSTFFFLFLPQLNERGWLFI